LPEPAAGSDPREAVQSPGQALGVAGGAAVLEQLAGALQLGPSGRLLASQQRQLATLLGGVRAEETEVALLDAAVTIRIGLADWVRVVAGLESPVAVMVTGRCRVEGDVSVAARLEAMFGGG
jgi:hypothetical protein